MMTIAEAVLEGANQLRTAGVPEARREAGSLIAHVLQKDTTFVLTRADEPLDTNEIKRFRDYIHERSMGKPLQYITGRQEFYKLEFEVTPDVLIPRPETELVIESALKLQPNAELICDVGTGSGCIAITLVYELPQARAVAIDISAAALEVAKRNADRHGVSDRIQFVQSDCFDSLLPTVFDLIVSNPPYVAESAVEGLQREVRDFEPRAALTPGGDGLTIVKKLLDQSPAFLKAEGHLLFEIGFDQHERVEQLIDRSKWKLLDIHQDLQGIPRLVALEKL